MAGVNKVILLGRLGADPEVRSLPSGSKVTTFSIATSEAYNNRDGQRVEQTEWHRIELWDNLANIAEQYLHKGDSVYVEGKIRTEEYTDKDNIVRKTTKIRGTSMTLVGGRSSEGGSESAQAVPAQQSRPAPERTPAPTPEFSSNTGSDDSDDLPF
ncbi:MULTISPECIES: single-stranded DNA-binding protein [unclassified Arcicella]|uniref:single-stranded DNA-binding protein n=1 Tax=unclassified Arcicella TaxID=2644986 RepID=UPI0028631329|nr:MULTISPECIES: single-stranded DNA-binding protein [unclassified Arcicella]MDR6563933.1 single-strand DNA-binding protein [Arcicella sp. BE51]MDR6813686.1 single-strand DNA-binding protein [Arcicella sp. BE140]MDR6824933.1 single-strand DNA-binding protein [Arcicella sp. BE139]